MAQQNKKTAENKDNLDSRSNEEFDTKGGNMLHNKKDHRNNTQKKSK